MKLYLLKRIGDVEYDECLAVVVRAKDELQARELASSQAVDEGADTWLDATETTCEVLTADGLPAVILADVWEA